MSWYGFCFLIFTTWQRARPTAWISFFMLPIRFSDNKSTVCLRGQWAQHGALVTLTSRLRCCRWSVSQEVGFERDAGRGLGGAAGGGVSAAGFSVQTLLVSFDGGFQARLQVRGRRNERPEEGRNTSNLSSRFRSFINSKWYMNCKCFTCWTRQTRFVTDYNLVVTCYRNTAECWGPRRIRSLSAASCRDRDAAGADPRAFSSRRKEMRRGNKMATSWGPEGQKTLNVRFCDKQDMMS